MKRFDLSDIGDEELNDIKSWLNEYGMSNDISRVWEIVLFGELSALDFADEDDATAFRLRFDI